MKATVRRCIATNPQTQRWELLLLRLLRGFIKDTGETLHTLNFNVQTKNDGSSRRDSDVNSFN